MIRVLLADDHPVVRDGLRGMLSAESDIEVAGEAASGSEAVALFASLRPDVVLMDLRMPGGDGVDAIEQIRAGHGSGAKIIVLTTYDTDADILRAVEAGATGYLLKDAPRADLLRAIRAAASGETVLAPVVAGRLVSRVRGPRARGAFRAGDRGAGAGRPRPDQRPDRPRAVRQRGDRQDAPHAGLHEARRDRPHGGGDQGDGDRRAAAARRRVVRSTTGPNARCAVYAPGPRVTDWL